MSKSVGNNKVAIIIITIIFILLLITFLVIIIYTKAKSKWIFAPYNTPKLINGYYPAGGTMTAEQLASYKAAVEQARKA